MHIVRDRPLVITGTYSGGLVSVIDIPSGHVRASRRFFRGTVRDIDASADGTRVLVAGTRYEGPDNPALGVWDLRDDSYFQLKDMERQLSGSAISSDGERAAWITHEYEGSTQLHIAPTSGGEAIVREVPEPIRGVVYASDGTALVLVGGDSVLVVDPQSGETRATLAVNGADRDIESSSNGRWHAVRGTDAVLVVDGRGRERARLNVRAKGARFNADGSELVLCVDDALVVYSGADLSEARETEVECSEDYPIDARHGPMAIMRGRTLTMRRDGADPIEIDLENHGGVTNFSFPTSRTRRWFLASAMGGLYIYNLRRQRIRRIVAPGSSESSAWSVERLGDVLRLKGRGWWRDFPREAEAEERPVTPPPGAFWHSTSPDRQAMIIVLDAFGAAQPALMVAGRDEPRRLSMPRSAVFECYDYEDGSACGGGKPVWGPGNQVVLPLQEGMLAYASNGRRIGHSTTARRVEYADDSTLLVEHADGALTLSTLRFQSRMRVFNARQGGEMRTTLDGNGRLAATRGLVLQIIDVASAEQQHRIELPAPATGDPTFVDDQVQVRTREGFFRWSLADASQTMHVDIDDVRALSDDESEVLYCAEGRLRWRLVAQEASTDVMPCPQPGWIDFDGDFIYWVAGNAGYVLRRSDGQRIVLRSLADGGYGFASTPQGHLFATDEGVLGSLRVRGPGPIYEASLEEVSADRLTSSLISDFLSGNTLR